MTSIDYLLFDLDQTLIDTFHAHNYLTNKLLAQLGLPPLTEEQTQELRITTPPEFLTKLIADPAVRKIALELRSSMMEDPNKTIAYPGVKEALTKATKSVKGIGLVTARKKRSTTILLEYHGLLRLFEKCCVTRENYTNRKPHPEPIEKALAIMGFNGNIGRVVYVGDTMENDYVAAQRAGVKFLGFGAEIQSQNRFSHYSELESALKRME